MKGHDGSGGRALPVALSVLAVALVALGATPLGYAAKRLVLPPNSVGTTQLKQRAVTAAKVKKHSLTAADFAAGQLAGGPAGTSGAKGGSGPRGPQGAPGPRGPAGPQGTAGPRGPIGPQGAAGPPGSSGITGWQLVQNTVVLSANQAGSVSVDCPTGDKALGGGITFYNSENTEDPLQTITQNGPNGTGTGWVAGAVNGNRDGTDVFVWAICANVS